MKKSFMKKPLFASVAFFLLAGVISLSGCGSKDEGDYIISENFNAIHLAENVKLEAVTDDTVTYTYTGEAPVLLEGQIIASSAGAGFLRRVKAVSFSDSTIIVQTEQATLTDAVQMGNVLETIPLTVGPSASLEGRKMELTRRLKGVGISEDGIPLNNVTIFSGGGLSVKIPTGYIKFDTNLDIGLKIKHWKVSEFHAVAGGSIEVDLNLQATATKTLSLGKEISIAQFSTVAVQFIGPVPVVEVITLDFLVGFDASMTGTMTAITGLQGAASVSFGARYDGYSWQGERNASKSMSADPPTFSGSAGVTLRGYVRPVISVKFYSVAGPYLGAEPYLEFAGTLVSGPALDWILSAGFDVVLGFEVKILSYEVADFNQHINVWSMQLANGQIGASYNLTGTWDLKWYEGGSYGLHVLILTQSGSTISGTLDSNAVSGSISGNTVSFVRPGSPPITFSGTIASGSNSMSGTWDDTMGSDNWSADKI